MYRARAAAALLAATGLARRELFAHDVIAVAKPYPDSQLLLERRGISRRRQNRGRFFQLNLYSLDLFGLPAELFADPEVNWHGQQLGRPGLIAAAGLFLEGSRAIVTVLQSDLCQQLYRHDELRTAWKTRVETHFGHWYVPLFNAVLDFCLATGITELYSPTGQSVVAKTEKAISPALFLRIYDDPAIRYLCEKADLGRVQYWKLSVPDNTARVARLAPLARTPASLTGPVIAVLHDIEEDVDTAVSVDRCKQHLTEMLRIERDGGVSATYSILGKLLNDKRQEILGSDRRHSIGFHSYDHESSGAQLRQCREVDLRIRGYRPPRSRITRHLTGRNLTFSNFEWLASAAPSFGHWRCRLENGLIKIPIHVDDYPLHRGILDYEAWEAGLFDLLRLRPFLAFSLHDCYAEHWLPHYSRLLEKLAKIAQFVTADDICDSIFLGGKDLRLLDADLPPSVGIVRSLARLIPRYGLPGSVRAVQVARLLWHSSPTGRSWANEKPAGKGG